MSQPDFNLLLTLDAVLTEGSVARAARRLHLSPSAMSRALARLRETTGDPLLVRAGRGLVPTPRAIELRQRVSALVQEVEAVLRPSETLDLRTLDRTFVIRARDGFVENFGPALIARVAREAPAVRLCFVEKPNKESTALREGAVDLETGVIGTGTGPEIRAQALFTDRFIGVVRPGHPLAAGDPAASLYAAASHIAVSRRGRERGPVDAAMAAHGVERRIATIVGTFSAAIALVRTTDLVATVPEQQTGNLRDGLHSFTLPLPVPSLTVALLWHPRQDADPAHRWLRTVVQETCAAPLRRAK